MAWEPKTQRAALIPIIRFNEILGLNVFQLSGRSRYSLSIIYNFTLIVLYFIVLYENKIKYTDNWIAYREISYVFVLWINIAVAILSIILGFVHTEYLKKIIAKCQHIDNTLESYGVKKNYIKTFRYVTCAIIIWSTIMLLFCGFDTWWFSRELSVKRGMYYSILLHAPFTINSMVILTFCIFIRNLQDKLHKVNTVLAEMYQLTNAYDVNIKRNTQPDIGRKITVVMAYYDQKCFIYHFLQVSRPIHLEIVRISRGLNQIYCYQLLLGLIVEFTLIVGSLYNLYFEIIKFNTTNVLENKTLLAMILWILAQVTAKSLRQLESYYLDNYIRDELRQFSLQLISHPLCFSAGGFVSLHNKFTTMFFGTIMTYITILIQMSSTPSAMKSLTQIVND